MVGARGRERDGLTLQHPRVSSRWTCHHVAGNMLLLLRSSLQHQRGGVVVVVDSRIVAGLRS